LKTDNDVAFWTGILQIPSGLCNILVSLLLYVPVTKRCGELPMILVPGVCLAGLYVLYGYLATQVWHLIVLRVASGLCMGFVVPASSTITARYANVVYPQQLALANGVPVLGMGLASAFGQNIIEGFFSSMGADEKGMQVSWIFAACWA